MNDRLNLGDDIEILERYDQEDDIYYVTMKTAEPSFAEEVDDVLLVEFGMFTNMPTGFRILNYAKNKITADAFKLKFKEACKAAGLRKLKSSETRQRQIERRIDRFFDAVGT
jgi:uncharacterized protein YuzE